MEKQRNILTQAARALPLHKVRRPAIAAGIAAREAHNLFAWAQRDEAALKRAGLDWSLVETLPARAELFSHWATELRRRKQRTSPAARQWRLARPKALELRNHLLRTFRFALWDNDEALGKFRRLGKSACGSAIFMDLRVLARIGRDFPGQLGSVGLDPALLDRAEAMGRELPVLLRHKYGEDTDTHTRDMRNRAFTLMDDAVRAIRRTARYALFGDPERLKGYPSEYRRLRARKAAAKKRAAAEAMQIPAPSSPEVLVTAQTAPAPQVLMLPKPGTTPASRSAGVAKFTLRPRAVLRPPFPERPPAPAADHVSDTAQVAGLPMLLVKAPDMERLVDCDDDLDTEGDWD